MFTVNRITKNNHIKSILIKYIKKIAKESITIYLHIDVLELFLPISKRSSLIVED